MSLFPSCLVAFAPRRTAAAALLSLLLVGPAWAGEGLSGAFAYAASIGADGEVLALEPAATGRAPVPQEAIDQGLREQLRARAYELAAGLEAPAPTWLQGSYALEPDGQDYRLVIRGLWAGPLLERMDPPRYPVPLIRRREDADLLMRIAVDADGGVQLAGIDGLGEARYRGVTRGALRDMAEQFTRGLVLRPEGADVGAPRAGELLVQVSLRLILEEGRRVPPEEVMDSLDWNHPWEKGLVQPGGVRVPDSDFAPEGIQVTGQRVRRGG